MEHIPTIIAAILGIAAAYFLLIGKNDAGFVLIALASVTFLSRFRMESKRRNLQRQEQYLAEQTQRETNDEADLNG